VSDDIFSRLFELFDQPGPVNWKLAAEVARHLAGEPEPIEPWAAEEFRELARLAEYRVGEVAPFRVDAALDVLPIDRRGWAEANLRSYAHLVEPFATSVAVEGPMAPIMDQMKPAIVGLQAGTLVGSLATWSISSFDAGLPQQPPGAMTLIVPNIAALDGEGDTDPKEVRLWVVANEVAFRSVSQLPWVSGHLQMLTNDYAEAVQIDPTKLGGMMNLGGDPEAIQEAIQDAGGIESLIDAEEAEGPRRELEALLGAVTGCSRLLARRGLGELSPSFDLISARRDHARSNVETAMPIGISAVPTDATQLGDAFNQEVESRYGEDSLETLWSDPSRMPSAAELRDPTGWAARVLLEGWE
jgi:putative hydrolase